MTTFGAIIAMDGIDVCFASLHECNQLDQCGAIAEEQKQTMRKPLFLITPNRERLETKIDPFEIMK
jgi:hypothetical protein